MSPLPPITTIFMMFLSVSGLMSCFGSLPGDLFNNTGMGACLSWDETARNFAGWELVAFRAKREIPFA